METPRRTFCQECSQNCLVEVESAPRLCLKRYHCIKAAAVPEKINHPDRLRQPLLKVKEGKGNWEPISWDRAMAVMAEQIQRITQLHGPLAMASATGSLYSRQRASTSRRLFSLLGFPNLFGPGHLCSGPGSQAEKLTYGGSTTPDVLNSRCILIWGTNPPATQPKTYQDMVKAKENGAKLIVVDPRYSEAAQMADLWLRIRPGADGALAMAMLYVITDENLYNQDWVSRWCVGFAELKERLQDYPPERVGPGIWIPPEQIRKAARMWATIKPASCRLFLGVNAQHINATRASRAVASLIALTGNLDVPGGNLTPTSTGGYLPLAVFEKVSRPPVELERQRLGADEFPLICGTRNVALGYSRSHTPSCIQAMRDGQIKGVVIFGSNMVVSEPNSRGVWQSLRNLEFLTVVDMFMTPTAELAHLVLPAAHWLEADTSMSSLNAVFAAPKILESPGECWDDRRIVLELAIRLGVNLPWKTIEEFEDYRVKGMGITYRDLASKGKISFPAEYRKYEKQGLATPSGKIELYSSILAKVGQDPLPAHEEPPLSPESTHELWAQYPLITAHYRTAEYQHSEGRQLASLRKRIPDPLCEIHPETAKRLSIGPGDWLYLETPGFSKRIRLKARFCAQLDPRVIGVPVQWWYPEEKDSFHGCFNSNINSIISGEPPYDPISGQYQVRANLCRVVKS